MRSKTDRTMVRLTLFVATATLMLTLATVTVLDARHDAAVALGVLADARGLPAATSVLSRALAVPQQDPAAATAQAVALVSSPALLDGLRVTAASGDAAGLPVALATAVAPHRDATAVAELAFRVTGLLDTASQSRQGAVITPQASTLRWVVAHAWALIWAGSLLSVGAAGLLLVARDSRRATGARLARWALASGGFPLLALVGLPTAVLALTQDARLVLASLVVRSLAAPAVPVLGALVLSGAAYWFGRAVVQRWAARSGGGSYGTPFTPSSASCGADTHGDGAHVPARSGAYSTADSWVTAPGVRRTAGAAAVLLSGELSTAARRRSRQSRAGLRD